jgi:hypothetical protein
VYNRYLVQLLVTLKERDPAAKRALSRGHRAIDTSSDEYARFGARHLPHARLAAIAAADALSDAVVLDAQVLADVPLRALLVQPLVLPADAPVAHRLRCLLYLLAVLSATLGGAEAEAQSQVPAALAQQVLKTVAALQRGTDEALELIAAVLDDDIRPLLMRLHEALVAAAEDEAAADAAADAEAGDANPLKGFENSKIADLAKEISEEINLDDLSVPDIFDFSKLGDSNSVLGSIVSKVGSKIQSKLQSGEVSRQDLMSEAISMISAFNVGGDGGQGGKGGKDGLGNPNVMLQQMMRAMQNGQMPPGAAAAAAAMFAGTGASSAAGTGTGTGASGTRARLRQKLDARKGA